MTLRQKLFSLAVLYAMSCIVFAQHLPKDVAVIARSATLLDSFAGKFLYEKAADERCFPASTTKILTALVVIEAGGLDQQVVAAAPDTNVEPTIIGLRPGDVYTRRELLYSLMLKSANDAALALARANAGSVPEFCRRMNIRARALGAESSNFVNPHGLHHPSHYSTAKDLALITRAALELPAFREIVSSPYHLWRQPDGQPAQLVNRNRLLTHYPGCTGVKTGFTRRAGQVLVSSALRDGVELISVVLNTTNTGIWKDSETLLDAGFEISSKTQRSGVNTNIVSSSQP